MRLVEQFQLKRQIKRAKHAFCDYIKQPRNTPDSDLVLFYISSYDENQDPELERKYDTWRKLVVALRRLEHKQ